MKAYAYPLELLADHVGRHPERPYLHQPVNRVWRTFTWREVDTQARRLASGLRAQGYEAGDRIAILSKNCAEWFIADFAIMMAGLVSVPIYPTASAATIRYVLEHSEARAIFLGKLDATEPADEAIGVACGIAGTALIANPPCWWSSWHRSCGSCCARAPRCHGWSWRSRPARSSPT